jgi:hypothetical protein
MAEVTPRSRDPVPELLGLEKYVKLRQRMKMYLLLSIFEIAALSLVEYAVSTLLVLSSAMGVFVQPLVLVTACIALIRCIWIGCLLWGYHRVKGAALTSAIRRMGELQSRQCWSLSESAFVCCTSFLLMWYGFMFMFALSSGSRHQDDTMYLLAFVFLLFAFTYWSVLKDAMQFINDERAPRDDQMVSLYNMYKTKEIEIASCKHLRSTSTIEPTMCSICLEDFSDTDDVAKLPCGHYFHPLCSHIWIRSHWKCPLRCDIGLQQPSEKKVIETIEEGLHVNQPASPFLRIAMERADRILATTQMETSSIESGLAQSQIPPNRSQRAIMERLYSHHDTSTVREATVASVSPQSELSAHVTHASALGANRDVEAGLATICALRSPRV